MKIKKYVAFALMGLALGACKRPGGDGPDVVDPEGKLIKAKLAIKMPRSIRTYTPGGADPYATADETAANRIDVFVYENGGSYATDHFAFTNNIGTDPIGGTVDFRIAENGPGEADDVYETATFQVREGNKLVYVGINLPALIRDRLSTGYYVNEIYEDPDLLSLLITPNTGPGVNGSASVPYFSSSRGANVTFTADDADNPDPDPFEISVTRLVAKVIVITPGGTTSTAFNDVSGGTVTNFEFGIRQVNNQMFVAPLAGLFGTDPSDPGKDPNHDAIGTTDNVGALTLQGVPVFQSIAALTGYKAVNDAIANFTLPANYVHYTTENTSAAHRHQDVTYVSVRAQFVPHKLGGDPLTGDAGLVNPDDAPPVGAHKLYAVFTGDNSGDGSDALGARYFYSLDDAREFVMGDYFVEQVLGQTSGAVTDSDNGGDYDADADPLESDFYIFEYDNSWCYYRIYLNPDGIAATGGTPGETNPYDVLRNTVYVATINGVNYIGTTNPVAIPGGYEDGTLSEAAANIAGQANLRGTPIHPGTWFPNLLAGTPIFPEDQIEEAAPYATGLSVSLSVEDWFPNEDDYELN